MGMLKLLQLLLMVLLFFGFADGACDSTNTEVFTAVDSSYPGYQTYAKISEEGARPLGFKKYTVQYQPPTPKCISISGAKGKGIEIMFETIPEAFLCLRDQTGEEQCGLTQFVDCDAAKADIMVYDFYYDVARGSSQSDITFWLRITMSQEVDPDLEFCHNRDNLFPSSLMKLKPGVEITPAPAPMEPPISGYAVKTTTFTVILALISSCVLIRGIHS